MSVDTTDYFRSLVAETFHEITDRISFAAECV